MKNNSNILVIALIIVAVISRLIPHPFNFTPIAGIALLSGSYIQNKAGKFFIPVLIMMISDVLLNYFVYSESALNFGFNFGVYISLILIVLIGNKIPSSRKVVSIGVASLSASILFFLITNFESWLVIPNLYTKDFSGLMTAYAAGIPFFGNTILGDLFYSFTLFGIMHLVLKSKKQITFAK